MKPVINIDALEMEAMEANTGPGELKYLALSTMAHADICEYPDSDKVGVIVGTEGTMDDMLLFRAGHAVEYYDGEV